MRTDSPVRKKEDDLLDRYDFAIDIVNGLLETFETGQDSVTIGLNGEWGAGKSSILEFIQSEIESQTKNETTLNIVFRFNPWLFTGQADLQKSFLTQLGIHLRTVNPQLKKLGEDIVLISSIIEIANVLNPEVLSRKLIGSGTKIIQKLAKSIGNEPSLQNLKKRIDDVLESSSIKVFIIIDDIDRLIPNEIANIFRLVNLNANFKNTFFFLSYDKDVVSKALTSEFHIDGEQFLEKIIQLDYSLPKLAPELIESLFIENFKKLAPKQEDFFKKEMSRIWQIGLGEYFSNLRHIYRYFNAIEIRYPAIQNEVNVIDFAAIEAIRIFDSKGFEWIYHNKESLVSKIQPLAPIGVEFEKPQNLLDFLNSNEKLEARQNTKFIINSIFYAIHLPEFSFSESEIDQEKLEREKRIAHKDYFDHYFSFKVSKNTVSEKVIESFINSEDETRDKIIEEYKTDKLSVFLKRTFYSLPKSRYVEIQKYLLDYSDRVQLHTLRKDVYSFDGLFIAISFLNDVGNKFGFKEYLEEILSKNDSYSRFYLQGFLRNRVIGSSNIEPVRYFPDDLVNQASKRITEAFKLTLDYFAKEYLASPNNYEISIINNLFRLLHEENIVLYKEKIIEYLTDVEKTLILFRCSLTVLSGVRGVSFSIQNDKYILPELTIEKLDSVLGGISIDDYKGANRDYLAVFLKLKEKEFNPYFHFTIDLEQIEF